MTAAALTEMLRGRFGEAILSAHQYRGDETLAVQCAALLRIGRFLKEDDATRMDLLMDLTAVDYSAFGKKKSPAFFSSSGVAVKPSLQIADENPWPGPPEDMRFTLVIHLYSTVHKHRLRLLVPIAEDSSEVDSLTPVWAGANWLEREVWDMFGIKFRGHSDLRRILMYDEFKGHPLRKDYRTNKRQPLIGPQN
jgi:NADH-quinone oxidoreductase subunit C